MNSSEYGTGTDPHRSRSTLVHMRLFQPHLKKITILRAKMYVNGTVNLCIRYPVCTVPNENPIYFYSFFLQIKG
jgi:hypothetical protein